jgi:heptosyltransferase-2
MKRLLILAPNWLGDAVMALPAIADVRRASPGMSIAVAARPSIAPFFGMVGDVNEVVTLESAQPNRDVASRKPEATLRNGDFEAALLLPNSFRAALIAARAGIRQRWGYRTQWRGPLLTRGVDPPPSGMHRVDHYQRHCRPSAFPTDRRRRGSICHLSCVTPARGR